ncbi:MAM and LDL-receptor class A domain-containing protein 1-like [Dermacentor silvarum]|uniref:MAM and LDL-receptor class A domain-containing protein 1-like n=1 Tax=Dermacentor silvarum TaxID=543639 RepID=UPI001896EE38|nr:MAM and LDL-receptor class A domain-containing protein 1-like [Dermacentor silvarum]
MWNKSLMFVTFVLLCSSALVIGSEQCTFEEGPCSDWVSTDCDDGACFVVKKVALMKNGPAVDRTMSSEGGSCAYSARGVATRGTTYASLSHNATGPLCFTAWYHQSGTEHEGAHFSVMHPDDDSPLDFYVTQREMAGSWQRVRYSERRTGAVVIQITHRVKDSPEKATFAVDDLTVESGPCASEPRSASCDFDWGDACGYEFGSGGNTWKLEDSGRESFKSIDYSTNTLLGGVAYLGSLGNSTRAPLRSPLVKGRKEMQCLQFHYYVPWSLSTPEKSYSLAAALKGSSQTTELLWSRTSKRLIRGEWTTVDVAFKQESDFKIQFSCSLIPEKFLPKPYCAIDAIRLYKCTGRRNFFDHHCNFEDGWCSWQNRYLPDPNVVSWLIGGEHLKTALPRPPHDHTFGNGTGSYLFVSNFERKKGDQAELIGDILSVDSTVTQCIEFWYIISGDDSAELKVLAIDPEHEARDNSPLWSQKGGGPVTWQQGRVAALHGRRPIFLATMGLASIPAYTALDDIAVKESHKCDTLPTSAEALSAVYVLTVTQASSPPSGATVISPKWNGQNEPQCLEFWYLESRGSDAHLQVELVVNDARKVVWRKPVHMERQWMLARVDIVQDKTFQVAFRANFSGSQVQSLSIDDVILRPDACDHPAECDFTDGSPSSFAYLDLTTGRAEDESEDERPKYYHSERIRVLLQRQSLDEA